MASVGEFISEIDKAYKGKPDILYQSFLKEFITEHREQFASAGLDLNILEEKAPIRYKILHALALLFYYKYLIKAFLQYVPEEVANLFHSIIWDGKQQIESLEDRFGLKIRSEKEMLQDVREAILPPYQVFILHYHQITILSGVKHKYANLQLDLTLSVRHHLKKITDPPKEAQLVPVHDTPASTFIYEQSPSFFEEFKAALAYYEQNRQEKIGKPAIKKVRDYFNIREFYPEKTGPLTTLRTQLLLQFIESCYDPRIQKPEVHQQLKGLFGLYLRGNFLNLPNLLFHIKGTKTFIDEDTSCNRTFFEVLASLPLMEWVSAGNIISHIHYLRPLIRLVKDYMVKGYLQFDAQRNGVKYREPLLLELYTPVITEPLIKASFFLYAALGLVDIGYNNPTAKQARDFGIPYFSVFDGLAYVRLTPLGAYVCDLYSTYQPPVSQKETQFILDTDRLIITLSEDDRVKALQLEKFATPVSETRYRVDYASFLKDCSYKKQIKVKIENFRSSVATKPPPIWEDFFNSLFTKSNAIQGKDDFLVYKLPATDKELHQLIARDEVLRTIVYKAENYHILVNKMDIEIFLKRMKEFGYMWE